MLIGGALMLNYKEYIYAIYQEHSFSKAAQKLFVSQPGSARW